MIPVPMGIMAPAPTVSITGMSFMHRFQQYFCVLNCFMKKTYCGRKCLVFISIIMLIKV